MPFNLLKMWRTGPLMKLSHGSKVWCKLWESSQESLLGLTISTPVFVRWLLHQLHLPFNKTLTDQCIRNLFSITSRSYSILSRNTLIGIGHAFFIRAHTVITVTHSIAALEDLNICLSNSKEKESLLRDFSEVLNMRLLQPGADTEDILDVYALIIKVTDINDEYQWLLHKKPWTRHSGYLILRAPC